MHTMKWSRSVILEEERVMRRMKVVAVALLAVSGMGMQTAPPSTIASGGEVFTLQMNISYDASYLNPIPA